MKTLLKIMSISGILIMLMTYTGCKDKDDPVPLNKIQLEKLTSSWKVSSVTLNGVDNTSYYEDFGIAIAGTNPTSFSYTTSKRPHYSPWLPGGKFVFGSDVATTIVRDKGTTDEVSVTYTVTDTRLELRFSFSGDPYNARTASVNGQWVFVFKL